MQGSRLGNVEVSAGVVVFNGVRFQNCSQSVLTVDSINVYVVAINVRLSRYKIHAKV